MTLYEPCILGFGHEVPLNVLTNQDLEKIVDTTDDWIIQMTGIKTRYILGKDQKLSDLAAAAGRKALDCAGLRTSDLGMTIVGTVTNEMDFPSSACITQGKLDRSLQIPAFDVAGGCSGFIFGLEIASNFIKSGQYNNILVIGAEHLSRIINYKDRSTCILFGDGAGAVVVGKNSVRGKIKATYLGSNYGEGEGKLYKFVGDNFYLEMNGPEILKLAVKKMSGTIMKLLDNLGKKVEDIGLLITHQANERIMDGVVKRIKIEKEKVFSNLKNYGNTSSASIPIALSEAYAQGRLVEGMLIILATFGAGLTWGGAAIEW